MSSNTTTYTVRQVAELSGVSVRTLHHYDEIGLLRPAARSEAGYRLYDVDDLLRLQQILLYRAMDLPLHEIAELLPSTRDEHIAALERHRERVAAQLDHTAAILSTINTTISQLREGFMHSDHRALYSGLAPEKIDEYEQYVDEHFDPDTVAQARANVRRMTKADIDATKVAWQSILTDLAAVMDEGPASIAAQDIIARHHQWLCQFWTPNAASYKGLGETYASHPDFVVQIDAVRQGLAIMLRDAMHVYAQTRMSER
jgi:MerR family transcriptional regulator, thiopeptide resistance regulator